MFQNLGEKRLKGISKNGRQLFYIKNQMLVNSSFNGQIKLGPDSAKNDLGTNIVNKLNDQMEDQNVQVSKENVKTVTFKTLINVGSY